MANKLYDEGREGILDGSIDLAAGAVKAIACDSGYTPNLATDKFLSDIPALNRISISAALGTKTFDAGVFDCDDPIFVSVPASKTINRVVLMIDTGVAGTSRLIGQVDTLESAVPISIPTGSGGGDVIFRWSDGAYKVFKL